MSRISLGFTKPFQQGDTWQTLPLKVYWSMAIFHTHVQGRINGTAHLDNKLLKWKMQVRTAKKPRGISVFVFVLNKTQEVESLLNELSSLIVTWQSEEGGSPAPLGTGSCCPKGLGGCWCCSAILSPGRQSLLLPLLRHKTPHPPA